MKIHGNNQFCRDFLAETESRNHIHIFDELMKRDLSYVSKGKQHTLQIIHAKFTIFSQVDAQAVIKLYAGLPFQHFQIKQYTL